MTRFSLLLLTATLFGSAALAAESTPSPSGTMPMWELKLPGGGSIFLVGSIHMLKPDAYPLPEAMEAAYTASPELWFETDMEALKNPESQMKLMELGIYSDGTTIKDHISPETYEKLTAFLQEQGVPAQMLMRFKPWMIALTLSVMAMQQLGYEPQYGLDQYFTDKAAEAGKPTAGLEEAMFQINLLASFSEYDDEAFLLKTIEELAEMETVMTRMNTAWKTGAMDDLSALMNESFDQFPEIAEKLLYARNRDWAEKIDAMVKSGKPAMIVVGAGHLAGKESVIELLAAKGHQFIQR